MRRARHSAYTEDGAPRYIRVYDNGGETFDRYTCCYTHRPGEHGPFRGMSEHPFHPQGFGQWGDNWPHNNHVDRPTSSHLGRRVQWEELPPDVQRCIMQDYVEYWGEFVKAEGKEVWIV